MALGRLAISMPSLFNQIGIDDLDAKWWHIAACHMMPINWFYDDYESDKELAKQIDQVCLSCPVSRQCFDEGVKFKEKGVRGGVYMDLGRPDKQYNAHKTPEVWKQIKKLHGKNNLHS